MKILVTGASGFLGYHVCRYMIGKGYDVVGIDIADFDYPDLKDKVKFYKGDVCNHVLFNRIAGGVDVVVHSAAALPLWAKEEIVRINVAGTDVVLHRAKNLDIKRVIYISSTAVYGIPERHPVYEYDLLKGVGSYGETKIRAEAICNKYREEGLFVSILRPKTFAGAMRMGVFQILCDWVSEGRNIPIIGNGKNRYQLLHVDDLVEAIHVAMLHPDANDTFNVGATEFGSMKSDLQALLDYAGFGKKVVCISSWLIIPALRVLEKLHLSPLYEWVYETAGKEHYVSVDKIRDRLGFVPKKSTADVWIDTYKWYVQEYANKKAEVGISHRVAWEQGILKQVKRMF